MGCNQKNSLIILQGVQLESRYRMHLEICLFMKRPNKPHKFGAQFGPVNGPLTNSIKLETVIPVVFVKFLHQGLFGLVMQVVKCKVCVVYNCFCCKCFFFFFVPPLFDCCYNYKILQPLADLQSLTDLQQLHFRKKNM